MLKKIFFPSLALYQRIFIGMITGCFTGLLCHLYASEGSWIFYLFQQFVTVIGHLFLSLLFMMILPLITSVLIISSHKLCQRSDMSSIATTIFTRALLLAFCASLVALATAFIMPNFYLSEALQAKIQQLASAQTSWSNAAKLSWDSIIPKNPFSALSRAFEGGSMIPVMIFAAIFGFSLAKSDHPKKQELLQILEVIQHTCFVWINWVMEKLAPLAVFCLIASSMQMLGLDLMRILGSYVGLVLLALAIQQFVIYSACLKFAAKIQVGSFFKAIRSVMLTAFSTSSSSATLPVSLEAAKTHLKLDPDTSRIILTFGASANQNGSALYEGVTVLFLCQLFNITLSYSDQFFVLIMCIVASFGTAGVPGATLPIMASILESLGVPASSLLLVLGLDRILDMARTTVNVTGDLVLAQWVDKLERKS